MAKKEKEFSFKDYFIPLTTSKAIHIIVIVGFIVFLNTLFNGFVWDDIGYIVINPEIHKFDLSALLGKNAFNDGWFYRPLQPLYFSSLYSLFKDTSFFYHLFQVLLHTINSSLVFILLRRFFPPYISIFLALIFLIHPIQVESVSFIAATGNVLFFFWGIIALLIAEKNNLTIKKISVLFFLLMFAILTKEAGFLFLFLVFLYLIIFKKKNAYVFMTVGFIFSLLYFLIRSSAVGNIDAHNNLAPITWLSFQERIINIPAIIFYYLKTFFFPAQLSIDQHWVVEAMDFSNFYFPLFILVLFFIFLGIIGIYLYKVNKKNFHTFLFFVSWFILGLSIHLQFIPLDMTVADRWFYFPIVGLLGIIGIIIQQLKFSKKNMHIIICIIALFSLLFLSIRTIIRNSNWQNNLKLYSNDIQINDNFDLENNLGVELMKIGQLKEANMRFRRSVELNPYDNNLSNLGVSYNKLGDLEKTKESYLKSVQAKTYNSKGHKHDISVWNNFLFYLIKYEDPKFAKKYIQEALLDYPDNVFFLQLLAIAEYNSGNYNQAFITAKKAYKLLPGKDTEYIYTQILNKKEIRL